MTVMNSHRSIEYSNCWTDYIIGLLLTVLISYLHGFYVLRLLRSLESWPILSTNPSQGHMSRVSRKPQLSTRSPKLTSLLHQPTSDRSRLYTCSLSTCRKGVGAQL